MSLRNQVDIQRRTDLRKYKAIIARSQRDFAETGAALGMIRVQKLYKDDGYASFEDFVEQEYDMSRRTAYRLVDAARVIHILCQHGTNGSKIVNQAQALELAPLGKDTAAMDKVITAAEARAGRVTAELLAEVRTELYPEATVIDGEVVQREIEAAEVPTREPEPVEPIPAPRKPEPAEVKEADVPRQRTVRAPVVEPVPAEITISTPVETYAQDPEPAHCPTCTCGQLTKEQR